MRFLILGASALGGLFGRRLLKGGADVTFLVRPRRAEQLARDGLVVRTQDGEIRTPVRMVQRGQITAPYDVILLCCKAYDLEDAVASMAPAMGPESVVLPLLNGMRHLDVLKEKFGAGRVLGALTAINAALLPDGSIQQSALRVNMNAIGELDGHKSERCEGIKQALDKGGIPTAVSDNIIAGMWLKFAGFVCNATIASLTRSRAGVIARAAAGASFVAAVVDECSRVAAAEGYNPPPQGVALIKGMFAQPDSKYGPSLLIDMEDGRPTEAEHTIGDLAARAEKHNVPAPILIAALCNLQTYEIMRHRRLHTDAIPLVAPHA
jgi:2-dehydropantoate 2-reductase